MSEDDDVNNFDGPPARAALDYAAAGLGVLPVHPISKVPLTGHGKDDATADPEVIAGWWDCWPGANVAVRVPEGIAVIDVDPRHGGDAALIELQQRYGVLPPTLTAATGGGGWHLWFAYRGPCRGRLADGLDLRSNAHYVVMPPSVHGSGRAYQWSVRAATAPAPGWLRGLLAPVRPVGRFVGAPGSGSAGGLVRAVAQAVEGSRNNVLYWAACRAFERGADDGLLSRLTDAGLTAGLAVSEVEATIASAGRTVAP